MPGPGEKRDPFDYTVAELVQLMQATDAGSVSMEFRSRPDSTPEWAVIVAQGETAQELLNLASRISEGDDVASPVLGPVS